VKSKPAVLYAAKSTEDRHGSIPDQLADSRTLAERDGLTVVGEYSDEAASAYRGNRGDGLAQAMRHAEQEGAALIVQHSDRLARGDGAQAQHLVELVLWARKAGVTLRSVQDPQTFDGMGLVYAALMGDRNHEDSARKSASVRDGLKRRRDDRGLALGAIPLGYRAEHVVVDGQPTTRRVVDDEGAGLYERIVRETERGMGTGQIARRLNAEGKRTRRGKPFTARAVRSILVNEAYVGGDSGYPALITRERWEAVQARLSSTDPTAVAARKGGRPPVKTTRALAGVAFCGHCGSRMYVRYGRHDRAYYACGSKLKTGLCDALSVRADAAESNVLLHVTTVLGEQLADWLAERAAEHETRRHALENAAERDRAHLRELRRTLDRAVEQHRRLLADEPALADSALRQVATIEADVHAAETAVGDAEARAAEFALPPDQRAAFDHLKYLAALVAGRLQEANGDAEAINAVLRAALEGVWLRVDGGVLHAAMRASSGVWARTEADPTAVALEGWASVGGPPEWLRGIEPDDGPYPTDLAAMLSRRYGPCLSFLRQAPRLWSEPLPFHGRDQAAVRREPPEGAHQRGRRSEACLRLHALPEGGQGHQGISNVVRRSRVRFRDRRAKPIIRVLPGRVSWRAKPTLWLIPV
jgi:site-specific DNA recombinase